jgi:hypothetical protein
VFLSLNLKDAAPVSDVFSRGVKKMIKIFAVEMLTKV